MVIDQSVGEDTYQDIIFGNGGDVVGSDGMFFSLLLIVY